MTSPTNATALASAPHEKGSLSLGKGQALVLCGIVLTSLNLRAAVTSLSAIFSQVAADIPSFNISLMGILPLLCFAVFGILTPAVKSRLGFERALFWSMAMVGAGLLVRACSSSFFVFALSSVLALAGMGFGNVLLPPLFKKYFPGHTGPITAIYSIMIAFSAGVPSVLSAETVGIYGWRLAIGVWGLIGVVAAFPWLFQMLSRPELCRPVASNAAGRTIAVYKWKQAWGMAILFGVGGMLPMYTIITWLPTYLIERGMTLSQAGMALFLYNTLGIFHSFLVPIFIGRMKHPFSLIVLALVLQLIGYIGLLYSVDHAMLWCILTAPGLLTIPATFQLFNLRSRTPEGATQLSSFVQFIGYLFAAVGPVLFGQLKTFSGGWTLPFWSLVAAAVIMTIAGYVSMQRKFLEDA